MSQTYHIIGLMSGTSCDGLDIAYSTFTYTDEWSFEIKKANTVSFPIDLEDRLKTAHLMSGLDLHLLDVEFGKWMGYQVKSFISNHQIKVDAIASHGHTIFHQPKHQLTLQIGNAWALHVACGTPVINDFRMLDVQLGGQGAPLVPIGDQMLFPSYAFCLNLGGIANISMDIDDKRKAFDICPFNLLLNHYANKLDLPYDDGGKIARSGTLIPGLLAELNELPYYQNQEAKSLGREDLEIYFEILAQFEQYKIEDKLHTLVAHYVYQVKKSIATPSGHMLVTGGGAFNKYFMETLRNAFEGQIHISDAKPILINFKEALLFAFLGVLRLRNEANCLASVTGAIRDNCGGMIVGM
ncbi:anhydro-N-acetylmuramic acid kinase [Belliella kenyensis]|uniref:Anhydro-N-acetylmuramic acid kinase n=1 Tax=Belliella kenyensis TaxID=1472724 RepID=A0ABV8EJZ4_9BACT|nr:anhydro-N-acetylmuramic acid kinase [Belliella kenyensis]MCH7401417.1 anhydro-N-acetylmuramic acid kinase [Belliella kenyensis]MDN3602860.1 anhydro-N-acetylmuramic acid kinase [Belliella kenyensis]